SLAVVFGEDRLGKFFDTAKPLLGKARRRRVGRRSQRQSAMFIWAGPLAQLTYHRCHYIAATRPEKKRLTTKFLALLSHLCRIQKIADSSSANSLRKLFRTEKQQPSANLLEL